MVFKRRCEQVKLIKNVEEKIMLNHKINIYELEKLLELNYEMVFEYNGKTYEIVQNSNYIELYNDCFYEDSIIKSLSYSRFTTPKDFIDNAKIDDKNITQIIKDIKIVSF